MIYENETEIVKTGADVGEISEYTRDVLREFFNTSELVLVSENGKLPQVFKSIGGKYKMMCTEVREQK